MSTLQFTALCAAGLVALAACSKDARDQSRETVADGTTAIEDENPDDDAPPSSSSGASFVPQDILGGNTSCDIWAQDCPEDEKCVAWSSMGDTWDANKCVSLIGDAQVGDECTYGGAALGTDDCAAGLMCYYINVDDIGSCLPLCKGKPEAPECPDGFNCSIANDGTLPLCVYRCDPLLQDCQVEGTGCFWDGAKFNCDPAGELLESEACGYINDCAPGHICMDAAALPECVGSACCTSFCELTEPHCQMAGTECVAFFADGMAPPGLENTGICALPGT